MATTFERLREAFERLPGVGPKGSQRFVLHLARVPESEAIALAEAIRSFRATLGKCVDCGSYTEGVPGQCKICKQRADSHSVCVVESFRDLLALEESGIWKGRYHIVGALISPMHGVGPDALNLRPLFRAAPNLEEVVLAIAPSMEGDMTSHWIAQELRKIAPGLKISQISTGIPVGGGLDFADPLTLARAVNNRQGWNE